MTDSELKRLCAVAYETAAHLGEFWGEVFTLGAPPVHEVADTAHDCIIAALQWEGDYPREKMQTFLEEYARTREAQS